MKVDKSNIKGNENIQSTKANDAKATKGAKNLREAGATSSSAGAAGASKVNVSDNAQSMQKAMSIAKNDSVDEAKVARLQKMIDEGKYNVDASKVADKMVDEHLLMTE